MNWYITVLQKYAVFDGRARRAEFWYFALINFIVSLVLSVIDSAVIGPVAGGLGIIGLIYSLAVLLPGIGVGIRRLHDTGRSGWWLLIALIPLVGTIILIVFFATAGQRGPNNYGNDPLEA